MSWEFWIDRGGTFTDVIGRAPDGSLRVAKLLSSATSPADGVRALLERSGAIAPGAPLPPCGLRLGTTVATNALLERRGVATLLVANRGLGDVLEIGTQERPELFALCIHKPRPLQRAVLELAGRAAADGALLEDLDPDAARAELRLARAGDRVGRDRADPRDRPAGARAAHRRDRARGGLRARGRVARDRERAGAARARRDGGGRRVSHAAAAAPRRGARARAARVAPALHAVLRRTRRRGALPRAVRAALRAGGRGGRRRARCGVDGLRAGGRLRHGRHLDRCLAARGGVAAARLRDAARWRAAEGADAARPQRRGGRRLALPLRRLPPHGGTRERGRRTGSALLRAPRGPRARADRR